MAPQAAPKPSRSLWGAEPWQVPGGFRIAYTRWVLDGREDWEQEHEFAEWDEAVYTTHEAALAAIIAHALATPTRLEP